MSLDRTRFGPIEGNRDPEADFKAAYLAEFRAYQAAGQTERANEVAVVLRQLGVEVDKAPVGVKERAVADPVLETAVPDDAPKRGRPKKTAE